jgi:A/G-specific adenine glycosylase
MELGSLICRPSEPACDRCPLFSVCAARAAGRQDEIPRPKPTKTYTLVREAAVVVRKNGRVLMRQCGPNERWAGLWDFPRFELEANGPLFAAEEIVNKVRNQTGIRCQLGSIWKTLKHGVTRYRITLDCYEANYLTGRLHKSRTPTTRWIAVARLEGLPLSTTGRRIASLIV